MPSLKEYRAKRDPDVTPEPFGGADTKSLAPRYSMQKHDARRLHFDLRLEWRGVLLSWAVTRGPSLDPREKRLAVRTEDHPLDYLDFEGVIPEGAYGAGRVMLWDIGYWQPDIEVGRGLKKGHLAFRLHGLRNTGAWDLVRMEKASRGTRENWLLIKKDDEAAGRADPVRAHVRSVKTGRTMAQIGVDAPPQDVGRKRRGKAPKFRPVQLATLADNAPPAEGRWNELKFDGYRGLVSIGAQGVRIFTRNGHDWSGKFAELIPALADLKADTALIDGEIVVGAGLSGFGTLQEAIKAGGPFTFYAFDLLHIDGDDTSSDTLDIRRKRLKQIVKSATQLGRVQLSPRLQDDPADALATVCAIGGEGIISKRVDAPYRGGRSTAWLKLKCEKRAEFVVVGYQPSEKPGRSFASLLLATQEDGLIYRGKVGTGFDSAAFDEIMSKMRPLVRKTAPVASAPADLKGAVWISPKLVAEVRYAEVTRDGHLRHASFVALREDKPASEVAMESSDERVDVAGIAVSSGDRVIFQRPKTTKLQVAEYYAEMAERILEVSADRPLSLVRLPEGLDGERFYQKHAGRGFPDSIRTVEIEEASGAVEDYMYVTDAAGLVGAAQMGTLEFHIWGARRDRLDRPDRLVFDLDPDEGLPLRYVKDAATTVRSALRGLGLDSAPLVTGGKGIHVVVPLRRTIGWDTLKIFAQTLALALAEREPNRLTANMSKAKRKGRVFIDWLRNERGSTAIAPFSLRARPKAPVAVPVTWDEVSALRRLPAFDIRSARDRTWEMADRPELQSISVTTIAALEDFLATETDAK